MNSKENACSGRRTEWMFFKGGASNDTHRFSRAVLLLPWLFALNQPFAWVTCYVEIQCRIQWGRRGEPHSSFSFLCPSTTVQGYPSIHSLKATYTKKVWGAKRKAGSTLPWRQHAYSGMKGWVLDFSITTMRPYTQNNLDEVSSPGLVNTEHL